jgi:hypothetical protein
VYWVEIVSSGARPQTWVRSNPIYVRDAPPPDAPPAPARIVDGAWIFDGRTTSGWHVEHDRASMAGIEVVPESGGEALALRFDLAGGANANQYAGMVFDAPSGFPGADRLVLNVRADRPMRLSVQVRSDTNDRWQRSIYVDESSRERVVRLDDMSYIGHPPAQSLTNDRIRGVLFVVETTNTKPGTSGRIWIRQAGLVK